MINGYIAQKYSLPLASVPPQLTMVARDISAYFIISQRLFTTQQLANSPWPDRFREAIDYLKAIADGAVVLTDSAAAIIEGRTDIAEVYSTTKDYHPTFWEGGATEQVQDQDKIDDEADRRDLGPFPRRLLD